MYRAPREERNQADQRQMSVHAGPCRMNVRSMFEYTNWHAQSVSALASNRRARVRSTQIKLSYSGMDWVSLLVYSQEDLAVCNRSYVVWCFKHEHYMRQSFTSKFWANLSCTVRDQSSSSRRSEGDLMIRLNSYRWGNPADLVSYTCPILSNLSPFSYYRPNHLVCLLYE